MGQHPLDYIISRPELAQRIFLHLNHRDFINCSLVNRTWFHATRETLPTRELTITHELLKTFASPKKLAALKKYIHNKGFKYARLITIRGWSMNGLVPAEIYDNLFTSNLAAKKLSLRGRGRWDTCKCPSNMPAVAGEQYDNVLPKDLTNFEHIYVSSTFQITACALLDLVSRSPYLKVLQFNGVILKHTHDLPFRNKRFYCDLERVYWPWPTRKHTETLKTILRRNSNVDTLHTNSETTCDLLASESLNGLRFLSLNLNENWHFRGSDKKEALKIVQRINYLGLAKNLEALEVRTFAIVCDNTDEKTTVSQDILNIFDTYKLTFWEQVAKLHKLKYLAVYGAWELEVVCREMARHGLQIEYLKINLTPASIILAQEQNEDALICSMADGMKNLRKMPKLKSLHFISYEKLASIDKKTVLALKELLDLFWKLEIKVAITDEVEELLYSAVKRGNQLGKVYSALLYVVPKDNISGQLMTTVPIRYSQGTAVKDFLANKAQLALNARSRKTAIESFYIWGLDQITNTRDQKKYAELHSDWTFYDEHFKNIFTCS